jgi:hypothetical protein
VTELIHPLSADGFDGRRDEMRMTTQRERPVSGPVSSGSDGPWSHERHHVEIRA